MASKGTQTPGRSDDLATEAPTSPDGSTKEDLLALIARLQNEKKDLQDQMAQRDAVQMAGREGWLISTPNAGYSGRTMGVLFENGHAFVPKGRTGAERVVGLLIHDFGYSATETKSGVETTDAEPEDTRSLAEKLTTPGRMG